MSELTKTDVYPLSDVTKVDLQRLYNAGFRLVTFDLDKTLAGQEELDLIPNRKLFFRTLGSIGLHGFQTAVVSNASGARINRVRAIANDIGQLTGRECISVVPSDVDGQKKPSPEMFRYALYRSGIEHPQWAIHFGDQVRSDVVGAERANFRAAVAVRPMGEGDDLAVRLIGRPFVEPPLRLSYSLPLRTSDFPDYLPDSAYRRGR